MPLFYMSRAFDTITSQELLKDVNLRRSFLSFYAKEYGQKLCGSCDSEIANHLYKHQSIIKNRPMATERLYRLPGTSIMMVHGVDPVNDASLTDEKAEAILKSNPKLISNFSKYPADWRERIGAVPAGAKAPASKPEDETAEVDTDTGNSDSAPEATEILASEAAKKLAAEHGIDLATIKGSGKGGNITKADVQAAIG